MCETDVIIDLLQKDSHTEGTVLYIICYLDNTHLTNFIDDKKTYLVYLTFGNIQSDIHSKPPKMTAVLLSLLPIKIKSAATSTTADEALRTFNANQFQ